MKKLVSVLLAAIMIFSLAACAKGGGTETTSAAPAQTEAAKTENTEAAETTASADAPAWEKDTSPIDMEWFVGALLVWLYLGQTACPPSISRRKRREHQYCYAYRRCV